MSPKTTNTKEKKTPQNRSTTTKKKKPTTNKKTQKKPIQAKPRKKNAAKSNIKSTVVLKRKRKKFESLQRKEKSAKKKSFKELLSKIEYSFTDVCPFISRLDNGFTGYKMRGDIFMNIYQVINNDYVNIAEKDILLQIERWSNHYKSMDSSEIKFIGLNLPVDTRTNKRNVKNVLAQTDNPEYKRVLREMLDEFDKLSDRQAKQFYMFIFSMSLEKLEKFNRRIRGILLPLGLVEEISAEQKEQIFRKLNNPYSI